ncbi:MAG TPA: acyl carrier protein [Candidatus Moranbacteria bacterium]|nr:acyl carrier protein [Candidatus Moranbacteria bacterium]
MVFCFWIFTFFIFLLYLAEWLNFVFFKLTIDNNGGDMNASIFWVVVSIVSRILEIDGERIFSESSLVDDLGASSLDFILVVEAIENQFGIEISQEIAREMNTVGDIVAYIEN